MITREQYLRGEFSHREYYSQFVTQGVKDKVLYRLPIETLKASTDPHFNDIQLSIWDSMMPIWPFYINSRIKQCGDYLTKAGAVCILKEAAKQIIEENV